MALKKLIVIESIPIPEWQDLAVNVTPEVAEQWLSNQAQNRSLSSKHVDALARALIQGDWVRTNDAIAFNSDGQLTNGQHRLTAIKTTGIAAKCLVVQGVNMEALDTGRKRSVADALDISGHSYTRVLAPALALIYKYENKSALTGGNVSPTATECKRILSAHPEIIESVEYGVKAKSLIPPGRGTFVHYMASRINKDLADEFMDRLADGVGLQKGSPILALRSRLIEHRQGNTLLHRDDIFDMVIKAWNMFHNRTECIVLKLARTESPVRFKEVTR